MVFHQNVAGGNLGVVKGLGAQLNFSGRGKGDFSVLQHFCPPTLKLIGQYSLIIELNHTIVN